MNCGRPFTVLGRVVTSTITPPAMYRLMEGFAIQKRKSPWNMISSKFDVLHFIETYEQNDDKNNLYAEQKSHFPCNAGEMFSDLG